MEINKIYNFRKLLKSTRKKKLKEAEQLPNTTFIGKTQANKDIYTHDDGKHFFICGTTGSGKTIALSNYIKSAIDKNYPLLIIDGKGDINRGSILEITKKLNENKKKLYVINLNNPKESHKYNPFQNTSATIAKDMLINMTEWSEEHYKLNTERYLQRLLINMEKAEIPFSFKTILDNIPASKFLALSTNLMKDKVISKEEHITNAEIAKNSAQIAENATARFSTIYESELGQIFNEDGVDIYTALYENAIILFILNPLIFPELSPMVGRLVLIDSKKAVSKLFTEQTGRTFFIFDEINVYASKSFLDLINKSRSASVTCISATQSLADLDACVSVEFKEQVIENCNNYIVLRQNSAKNAEQWSNILGTKSTMEVTYQLKQQGFNTSETGFGSAKRVKEYYYHPDEIKTLKTGKGIYLSKDTGYHCKVNINNPIQGGE